MIVSSQILIGLHHYLTFFSNKADFFYLFKLLIINNLNLCFLVLSKKI